MIALCLAAMCYDCSAVTRCACAKLMPLENSVLISLVFVVLSFTDDSPVMLESESRYLPVLADSVPVSDDCSSSVTLKSVGDSVSSSAASSYQSKDKKIASTSARNRPVSRRVVANFSKSQHQPTVVDVVAKSKDSKKTNADEIGVVTASLLVDGQRESYTLSSDSSRISSSLQSALSVETSKSSTVPPNDAVKPGPVISHSTSPRQKSQSMATYSPGERRRLLKGVKIKKSPGRRDESGLLLATSSSLYTPEKYRNTMRQIFGDTGMDEDKQHVVKPDSRQSKNNRQRLHSDADSTLLSCILLRCLQLQQ